MQRILVRLNEKIILKSALYILGKMKTKNREKCGRITQTIKNYIL